MLQAHIERALHDHFLFRKLTDSQCHVLLDCMQRVEVQPGDVVVQQVIILSLLDIHEIVRAFLERENTFIMHS